VADREGNPRLGYRQVTVTGSMVQLVLQDPPEAMAPALRVSLPRAASRHQTRQVSHLPPESSRSRTQRRARARLLRPL
jgi:hypothetical protein